MTTRGSSAANGSLVTAVVSQLREDILSGRFPATQRLLEKRLAEDYGVSRVPVREALRLLEGEGLVSTPAPGVRVVADVGDADADEVFAVRATVETMAAGRAALQALPAQVAQLRALLHEGQECLFRGDLAALPRLNTDLHRLIAEASGSSMLPGLLSQMSHKVARYYSDIVTQRAMSSWREHAQIVEAIAAHDADGARQVMREHIAASHLTHREHRPRADTAARPAPPSLHTVGGNDTDRGIWRVPPAGFPLLAGAAGGPLHGVRLAVKDLYAIRGHATGAGNPAWLSQAPRERRTARVVQQLVDAGADAVGIAQADELAFSVGGVNPHYGSPVNAAAPGHLTGGSSSGPAAAVAAGLADLGLGTDTAGSTRVPASYCGLWGLRTTFGAVSTEGVIGLAPSFDAVGLLTADVELLGRVVDTLLPEQITVPIDRLVTLPALVGLLPASGVDAFRSITSALSAEFGTELELLDVAAAEVDAWFAAFRTVQHAEAWRLHGEFIERNPGALGRDVEERFLVGRVVSAEREQEARRVVAGAAGTTRSWLTPGTALVLPSTPGPSPRLDSENEEFGFTRRATLKLNFLAPLAGLPALCAPLSSVDNLPVGVTLSALPGQDATLVAALAAANLSR